MITAKFNDSLFTKEMNNIIEYSLGFLEGIQSGKKVFLSNVGSNTIELLKQYVDSNARSNPKALHHIYEWMETGSPSARLYDVEYTTSNLGLSFKSYFRQSESIKPGSDVPFYNKAEIMENATPVIIKPKKGSVLAFNDNGEQVFTRKPITITDPGGQQVRGSYEKVFDEFFNFYFTQAFLMSSGIADYLENPIAYKQNLSIGKRSGRSAGVSTGYKWIANAGIA
jgi:hypothetical protein